MLISLQHREREEGQREIERTERRGGGRPDLRHAPLQVKVPLRLAGTRGHVVLHLSLPISLSSLSPTSPLPALLFFSLSLYITFSLFLSPPPPTPHTHLS